MATNKEKIEYLAKAFDAYRDVMFNLGFITSVHDGDCPKCKYPETIYVMNTNKNKVIAEYCSAYCGWSRIKKSK